VKRVALAGMVKWAGGGRPGRTSMIGRRLDAGNIVGQRPSAILKWVDARYLAREPCRRIAKMQTDPVPRLAMRRHFAPQARCRVLLLVTVCCGSGVPAGSLGQRAFRRPRCLWRSTPLAISAAIGPRGFCRPRSSWPRKRRRTDSATKPRKRSSALAARARQVAGATGDPAALTRYVARRCRHSARAADPEKVVRLDGTRCWRAPIGRAWQQPPQ
jgi:hypothetical protein